MAHYSRRLFARYIAELQSGDLIDISATASPYWSVVDRIGDCDDDEDADEHCDGDCLGVVFHVDEGDVAGWHITRDEVGVYARFQADVDQAVIDAENDTHAAAAAARGTALAEVGQ